MYYKKCKIKQYHTNNQALRTETTIHDTYDFALGRSLSNLPAVRRMGFAANRRLLRAQYLYVGENRFQSLNQATFVEDQRVSGLRFGDPRVQALMHGLCLFTLLPTGFRNRDLREHIAQLLGFDPGTYGSGRMTYDLRRLRLHGLIERIPHTHRYQVTTRGAIAALFYVRFYNRARRPGFSTEFDPAVAHLPPKRRTAVARLQGAIDHLLKEKLLASGFLQPLVAIDTHPSGNQKHVGRAFWKRVA